jgi:hypothetical protein
LQNFEPEGSSVPQRMHLFTAETGVPQFRQNLLFGGSSFPQFLQASPAES